jgi:hypothetical protein
MSPARHRSDPHDRRGPPWPVSKLLRPHAFFGASEIVDYRPKVPKTRPVASWTETYLPLALKANRIAAVTPRIKTVKLPDRETASR